MELLIYHHFITELNYSIFTPTEITQFLQPLVNKLRIIC